MGWNTFLYLYQQFPWLGHILHFLRTVHQEKEKWSLINWFQNVVECVRFTNCDSLDLEATDIHKVFIDNPLVECQKRGSHISHLILWHSANQPPFSNCTHLYLHQNLVETIAQGIARIRKYPATAEFSGQPVIIDGVIRSTIHVNNKVTKEHFNIFVFPEGRRP